MTHHLGKHSLTSELNVTESLTVAGVNIIETLDSLTADLASTLCEVDIQNKQDNLSINNLSNSTFQNTLYPLGGLHLENLSTGSTLTYVPPIIRDWTQDQLDIDIVGHALEFFTLGVRF